MKNRSIQYNRITAAAVLIALLPLVSQAQEGATSEADAKAKFKADSTGTNPINFTYDARIYHEYQGLNTLGDGSQNITTLELRAPLGEGKWQFRGKLRYNSRDANNKDESGFGDTDLRFMTVAYMNMKKGFAVAPGVEFMLPTATDPTLGSGAYTVAPFVFVPYFNVIGKGSIFAPGYQHFISLDEDPGRNKVHQGIIDLFLVKTFANSQYWGYIDPQIILDYENSNQFMQLELQAGMMLDRFVGAKGHSIWIMPSFGLGDDAPYDYSVEFGYKYVWR